jgi:2-dehydro-3-deoxygluconokinase
MLDIVTIGETMVLLTPMNPGSLKYVDYFKKQIGGAESNFAIGIARLGHKSGWISKVGDDPFGKYIVSFIRGEGVDTSRVRVDKGSPTGVYFKEFCQDHNPKIYYYRKGSAASNMNCCELDEEYIASAKYFHITGITPLLSETAREMVSKAIEIAKKNNVIISFDPNIRKKLCSEEECRKILRDILPQCDIFLPGYSEAKFLLHDGEPDELCKELLSMGIKTVAMKLGKEGCIVANSSMVKTIQGVKIEKVVDTVGAGDGFDAGFMTGMLNGWDIEKCGRLANVVGAMVVMVVGDMEGLPTMEEVSEFEDEVGSQGN